MALLLHTIYGQPNAAKAARNMSQIFQEIRVCIAYLVKIFLEPLYRKNVLILIKGIKLYCNSRLRLVSISDDMAS